MVAQSRIALTAGIFLASSVIALSQTPSAPKLTAADLVKAVIQRELRPSDSDSRWKYVLYKQSDGKQETREVIETKSGSLERLIDVGGKPLAESQKRDETERILKLSHNPAQQRRMEEARRKDAQQCNTFMQMIPDAFLFDYAGTSGNLVKVEFKPNPQWNPPSREGRILHEMAGEIWVDPKQQRLVSINGQTINEVKFGGGLLGHLEKGGQFTVKRAEIAPGQWELTDLTVNMQGKALMFKTISVQQKELHKNFERVPDDLNLVDAADILLKQAVVAEK
jgi:hypothetical protein